MKYMLVLMIILTTFVAIGCTQIDSQTSNTQVENTQQESKLTVVTTLFPLYEFAKQVGGPEVDVTLLLPPGVEPHSFEPKPSDIKKIAEADAFLYIGEIMEPWAHDILEGIDNQELTIIDTSSLVQLLEHSEDEHHDDEHSDEHSDEHDESEHENEHSEEHEEENHEEDVHEEEMHDDHHDEHEEAGHDEHDDHDHGAFDPHIWLDLQNDQVIVQEIANTFIALDAQNADMYAANGQSYIEQLQALDQKYLDELQECSQEEFLVGGHNFFGYIEQRYNIEGISAIENLAPSTEPTPRAIQEITDVANEHGVKYILTEVLVSQQMADAIAEEAGAEVLVFHPAPNLPRDDFDNGATFLSVMEENLATLKTALECS